MELLRPPPLPDLPLARRAEAPMPPPIPPPIPRQLAPAGRALRFILFMPLPVVAIASALLLLKLYRSGGDFRHEISHGFVKFFDSIVFAGATGATLLTATIVLCCVWKRLSGRVRRGSVALVIGGAIVAGGALISMEGTFRAGKHAAYARANPALLMADCRALAAAVAATTQPTGVNPAWVDGKDRRLPPYVRSLRPRYVVVSDGHVRVVMAVAPISGVHEEGFWVPLTPAPDAMRGVAVPHVPLDTNTSVYRYGW